MNAVLAANRNKELFAFGGQFISSKALYIPSLTGIKEKEAGITRNQ